jgi:predicted nucleotidyltransferase
MEDFLDEIVKNLLSMEPSKIILFGSYASGTYDGQSDIDLVVVLDTKETPETFDEKLELKVKVRDCIYELSRRMPIDLVVYTYGEFEVLQNRKTSFYNEIMGSGKIIYEKAG